MRVLVTGGTGFVGSHTVAALKREGHEPRLLVRSAAKVAPALEPHGVEVEDVVEGDVLDREAVGSAMEGVDAAIHGANVFSFQPRDFTQMLAVTEGGTEIVLGEAVERGLDPIVHVSSTVALLPAADRIGPDTPVGEPSPAYARSKARAEWIARGHQERGAPVVTTYPGAVWGPHDPHLGESSRLALSALNGSMRVLNDGLLPISDVRDVAQVHAKVLEPDLGPRRFVATGHDVRLRELMARLGEIAGRNLWSLRVPSAGALLAGRMADGVARITGARLPLNYEGPWLTANGARTDNSALSEELGVAVRPLDETLADTVRWLVEAGHLKPRRAPKLAS